MAYSTSNPPMLAVQALTRSSSGAGDKAPRIWLYSSTDASTVVGVDGYITNGDALGMKANDIVWSVNLATGQVSSLAVGSVTASSAANLFDPTTVGATANTT